jgi:hypothetical protein
MTDKKTLHVVEPTPTHGERAALKPDKNPALKGKGDVSLICGKCRAVLARDIWGGSIFDIGIICAECGTLVRRIYGHLGTVRHRAEVVEYRVRDFLKLEHREKPVREWVKALRSLKVA